VRKGDAVTVFEFGRTGGVIDELKPGGVDRAVGFDGDPKAFPLKPRDKFGHCGYKRRLSAGQDHAFRLEGFYLLDKFFKRKRERHFNIGIAPGAIEIAPGKTNENARPPGIAAFALKRLEDFD
jgi:hypothetical protein